MTNQKRKVTQKGKPGRVGHPTGTDDLEDLTEEERARVDPEIEAEDAVEEADIGSFPASDPPSFTPTRAGKPDRDPINDKP